MSSTFTQDARLEDPVDQAMEEISHYELEAFRELKLIIVKQPRKITSAYVRFRIKVIDFLHDNHAKAIAKLGQAFAKIGVEDNYSRKICQSSTNQMNDLVNNIKDQIRWLIRSPAYVGDPSEPGQNRLLDQIKHSVQTNLAQTSLFHQRQDESVEYPSLLLQIKQETDTDQDHEDESCEDDNEAASAMMSSDESNSEDESTTDNEQDLVEEPTGLQPPPVVTDPQVQQTAPSGHHQQVVHAPVFPQQHPPCLQVQDISNPVFPSLNFTPGPQVQHCQPDPTTGHPKVVTDPGDYNNTIEELRQTELSITRNFDIIDQIFDNFHDPSVDSVNNHIKN